MSNDLIVFGEDWGGLPSSTQHLIRHLSEKRNIVWVNSIGLRQPSFSKRDLQRIIQKVFDKNTKKSNSPKRVNEIPQGNFHIVNPLTIPAPRSKFGRWLATKLIVSQVKPILRKARFSRPTLWTSLPTAVDVVGHFNESALIYYCGDDFSALAGVDHDTVAKREEELIEKSDLILAASEKLASSFPSKTTKLLRHGVDYNLFTKPALRANDLPNDGRPIAGFYGSISEWLDINLLCETIKQLPNWYFVFIGKSVVDTSALSSFDNVLFIGEKTHSELPSYSQHWTVSLLPFKDNAQIRACNPLKLREYLAAGSPIISTPFPALEPFKEVLQTVNSSDEMVKALISSETMKSQAFIENSRSKVVEHSWSARAQQVNNWINLL